MAHFNGAFLLLVNKQYVVESFQKGFLSFQKSLYKGHIVEKEYSSWMQKIEGGKIFWMGSLLSRLLKIESKTGFYIGIWWKIGQNFIIYKEIENRVTGGRKREKSLWTGYPSLEKWLLV